MPPARTLQLEPLARAAARGLGGGLCGAAAPVQREQLPPLRPLPLFSLLRAGRTPASYGKYERRAASERRSSRRTHLLAPLRSGGLAGGRGA